MRLLSRPGRFYAMVQQHITAQRIILVTDVEGYGD